MWLTYMTQLQSLSIEVPQVKDGAIDCTFGSSLSISFFVMWSISRRKTAASIEKCNLFHFFFLQMSYFWKDQLLRVSSSLLPKVIKPKTTICSNHSYFGAEVTLHTVNTGRSSMSVWMIMIAEFSAMLQGIAIRCHADFSLNDSLSKCEIGLLLWHPNTAPWHYSSKELPTE